MSVPISICGEIGRWFDLKVRETGPPMNSIYAAAAREAREGRFDDGHFKLIGDALDFSTDPIEQAKFERWLAAIRS